MGPNVEWKYNLVKSCQENTDGPVNNLRRKRVCFHRERANIGKIRDNLFLMLNDLPVSLMLNDLPVSG